jgi:hypothetical protein
MWATSACPGERVEKRAYPEDKHLVPIAGAEFESFVKDLEKR